MKFKAALFALLATFISFGSHAQLTVDTSLPDQVFGIGIRMGGSVSNTSSNQAQEVNSVKTYVGDWKGGFTAGAVVDINLREFFAIQPGFYYSSSSHGYVSTGTNADNFAYVINSTSTAHRFRVPILASFRFNLGNDVKLIAEAGPYFDWGFGGNQEYNYNVFDGTDPSKDLHKRSYFGNVSRRYDCGLEFGVGASYGRYSLHVHYLAGARNVVLPNSCVDPGATSAECNRLSGHNKMWQFTIGYKI